MNFQKIIFAGEAVYDPERRTSKDGRVTYTTLRIVVIGEGRRGRVFFPVMIFGKQGELVATHATKGREALVEGHLETSISGYMSVIAERVVVGDLRKERREAVTVEVQAEVANYKEIVEAEAAVIH